MSKFIDGSLSDEEMEENSDENSNENIEEGEEDNSISSSNSEAEMYKHIKTEVYKDYKPSNNEIIEFNKSMNTIKTEIEKVNSQLDSLDKNLDDEKLELKYGISFFESKYQLFIMYLTELICYISEKISGKNSIEKSPLIKQLIILKGLIEKSKVIDMKLKPQVDRLLSIANNKEKNNIESKFKSKLLDNENEELEEEEEENSNFLKLIMKKKKEKDKLNMIKKN